MTWYEFLLFVHITCAVIWLGGAFFLQVYAIAVTRGGDPEEMGRFAGRTGTLSERVFIPASLLVILAGVGLMIEGSWGWGQLWVVFALATFGASFLTGLLVLSPLAKRIPLAGPATPEGQALIRRIFMISRVDLAFMYAIVFAMTVKPTSDDGLVVLVAAAILVALSIVFLAPLRGGSAGEDRATATS
jgi:uncharacterized membrane protein